MSKRRLQVILTEEAWAAVDAVTKEANQGLVGSINYSDTINEMILTAKVDIKVFQSKHTNIRRSLRLMAANENLDIDDVIKSLMDLKAKTGRKARAVREPESE
jgi:hypothetical protein